MYINHSCDPNCETEELRGRVWVLSLRRIAPGEELTYDYNLYDGDEDDAHCHCGAAACRQTMYSPEEITRRKKAAKRKTAKAPGKRVLARAK
jgi:glucan biosynthesis protein